jgi:DNA-binding response OmpR family regulator
MDAGGRIVTRDELYERSGGGVLRPGSRTIDVHVALIRRSLGSLGRYLIAVPERGYRIDVIGLESSR